MATAAAFMDRFRAWEGAARSHGAGTLSTKVLHRIESTLPGACAASAETGCGRSTVLFSNLSARHRVFALDDRVSGPSSSVAYFLDCPLTRHAALDLVFGPTQRTLPGFAGHDAYDFVLLDGPHAYPFPELEYFFLYPHLRPGGFLILDNVEIPTVARLADFVAEDEMFEHAATFERTALFRRTGAPTFDAFGDGWETQAYNRRRLPRGSPFFLGDGRPRSAFSGGDFGRRWLWAKRLRRLLRARSGR